MNLTEPKTIKYKPIWLIVIALILIAFISNAFQYVGNEKFINELKEQNKKEREIRAEQREKDSIALVKFDDSLRVTNLMMQEMSSEIKIYKNRAYANYKKYINEQNLNYNNSDDATKTSTFTGLIRE